jgi:hypothetical protein
MSDGGTLTMSTDFPRWYRAVDMGEHLEQVRRRWQGIANLVGKAAEAEVGAMLAVAFATKPKPTVTALASIREAFKAADDLFDSHGNDRELEVLCGAALATLFERGGEICAFAALGATTASCGNARPTNLPMDIPGLAERAIAAMAEKRRARPDLSASVLGVPPKLSFEQASTFVKQNWNQDGVAQGFALAAQATDSAVGGIVGMLGSLAAAVTDFAAIQDEELQMLWWLFGGRSAEMDCAFDAIQPDAQPLILAAELADMTKLLPGPVSAKPILSRAGLREQRRCTIPAAVNACDAEWLARRIEGHDVSPVMQPIHFAIQRKLETGDEASWVAGWSGAVGIETGHGLPALALGNLFYRERLLALRAGE